MAQNYKIYIKDKLVYLAKKPVDKKMNHTFYKNSKSLKSLRTAGKKPITIIHGNLKELWQEFQSTYDPIVAAGGLVKNEYGKYLMIFRRGKWDLPKGKIDPKENIAQCAVREVMEETGLRKVKLGRAILTTYHCYTMSRRWSLKTTYWFEMTVEGAPRLTPQIDEDIFKAQWLSKKEVKAFYKKSFPNIVDVCEAYF